MITNTIYVVALEPIDQRYTAQWYDSIPKEIKDFWGDVVNVVTVDGGDIGSSTTPGAFLDFAMTNVWKNNQINKIAVLFSQGKINAGDVFLFTDAWNSGIIQVKYMSELLDIPVELHGIFHAGAYDETDILGFTIKDKEWVHTFERSLYHALDYSWFGSKYHKDLFCRVLGVDGLKARHSGQPHSQILEQAVESSISGKEDIILFGHRISPDKNPEIFEDLAEALPHYEFVFSQKMNLSKAEYYALIRKAKISFSANKHENFGISMVEAVFNGTVPLVPDRLSYSEMYLDEFTYPSEWTENWDSYLRHKEEVIDRIVDIMWNYKKYHDALKKQKEFLLNHYMTAKEMVIAL